MTIEIEIVPCLSDNYAYLVKAGEPAPWWTRPSRAGARRRWRRGAGR